VTPSLAKALLADRQPGVQLLYGVATGTNTVKVAGSTVAVTLPALESVFAGDYVAILAAGADRLIVGKVGASTYTDADTRVQVTNGSGHMTLAYNVTFVGSPIVVVTNGDAASATFAPAIVSRGSSSAVIATGLASVAVRVDYVAVGARAS
jgi:hypothetical protein